MVFFLLQTGRHLQLVFDQIDIAINFASFHVFSIALVDMTLDVSAVAGFGSSYRSL